MRILWGNVHQVPNRYRSLNLSLKVLFLPLPYTNRVSKVLKSDCGHHMFLLRYLLSLEAKWFWRYGEPNNHVFKVEANQSGLFVTAFDLLKYFKDLKQKLKGK